MRIFLKFADLNPLLTKGALVEVHVAAVITVHGDENFLNRKLAVAILFENDRPCDGDVHAGVAATINRDTGIPCQLAVAENPTPEIVELGDEQSELKMTHHRICGSNCSCPRRGKLNVVTHHPSPRIEGTVAGSARRLNRMD